MYYCLSNVKFPASLKVFDYTVNAQNFLAESKQKCLKICFQLPASACTAERTRSCEGRCSQFSKLESYLHTRYDPVRTSDVYKPDKACNCFPPPAEQVDSVDRRMANRKNTVYINKLKMGASVLKGKTERGSMKRTFVAKTVCVSFFHLSVCINRA